MTWRKVSAVHAAGHLDKFFEMSSNTIALIVATVETKEVLSRAAEYIREQNKGKEN